MPHALHELASHSATATPVECPLIHPTEARSNDVIKQSRMTEQGDQSTARLKRSDIATQDSSKQDINRRMSVSEDSTTLSTAPLGTLTVSSVVSPDAMNSLQQEESSVMPIVGSSGEVLNQTRDANDPVTKREVPSQNEAAGVRTKNPSKDDLALEIKKRASIHRVMDRTGESQKMSLVTSIAASALEPKRMSPDPLSLKHPREAQVFTLDPQSSLCSYNSVYNQTFHRNPNYPSIHNPSHPNVSNNPLSKSLSGVPSFTRQHLLIRARSPEACWEMNPESTMHLNTALCSAPVSVQVLLASCMCDVISTYDVNDFTLIHLMYSLFPFTLKCMYFMPWLIRMYILFTCKLKRFISLI